MNKEDLKEGEIYFYTYESNHSYIFRYKKIENQYQVLSEIYTGGLNSYNYKNKDCYMIHIENCSRLKQATPEQKHWLLECEKADKFISYDQAMKTFVKEFVLPEKWCIKITQENRSILIKYWKTLDLGGWNNEYNFHGHLLSNKNDGSYLFWGYNTEALINQDFTEITLNQFKKYILKENNKSYEILKQEDNNIIEVSNEEGNIFKIGDYTKSLNSDQKGKITSFKYSVNKSQILALTEYQKNGISINKIEHYIEKDDFVLPEFWCIKCNNSNYKLVKEWAGFYCWNSNFDRIITSKKTWDHINSIDLHHYTEITFEQFKKYVLKEDEVKDVKLPIVGEVEESLLDKARRLYPIGTKFKSVFDSNIYEVKDIAFKFSIYVETIWVKTKYGEKIIYINNRWAEIIEQPKPEQSLFTVHQFIKLDNNTIFDLNEENKYLFKKGVSIKDWNGYTLEELLYNDNFKIYSLMNNKTKEIILI